MTRNWLLRTIVLLLGFPAVTTAGSLNWVPAAPYPTKSSCQPISFDEPDAIALDRMNDIYIANEVGPNAVQELTAGGTGAIRTILSRSVEPIKSGHYFGLSLAVDAAGRLYLAVRARGTIERLNANGTLTVIAGKAGERKLLDGPQSDARLNAPNAIAISPDGAIYIADTRTIRKIGRSGAIMTLAGNRQIKIANALGYPNFANGRARQAAFISLKGIAVGRKGTIYVTDSYIGDEEGQGVEVGVIREVSPLGSVSTLAGAIDTTGSYDIDGVGEHAVFGGINGIAIAANGILYVTESSNGIGSIRRIDADAAVTTVARSPYAGDVKTSGLINPVGIAITSNGVLYITDREGLDFKRWHVDWLHRVVGNRVDTLCQRAGLTK